MGKSIDLILHAERGGHENMDLDRAALERADQGHASLRIYRWDRPTVTLGKSQRPEDVSALFPDLPTVPRPTGGGAVLHGFDVTVALAMPLEMLGVAPRALHETYTRLVTPLARALTACGLPCHLAEEGSQGIGLDCFASAGRTDLIHRETGKKVAGCALAATRSAALLHVSIPVVSPPEWLRLDSTTATHYSNPTWRSEWFAQAFPAALRETYPVSLKTLDPALPPLERAKMILWHEVDLLR
ncbi:lipoate--protein ligase family protein, partial [bacterium]